MITPTNKRTVELQDGNRIPVIGLGTFLSKPNEVESAVLAAYETVVPQNENGAYNSMQLEMWYATF